MVPKYWVSRCAAPHNSVAACIAAFRFQDPPAVAVAPASPLRLWDPWFQGRIALWNFPVRGAHNSSSDPHVFCLLLSWQPHLHSLSLFYWPLPSLPWWHPATPGLPLCSLCCCCSLFMVPSLSTLTIMNVRSGQEYSFVGSQCHNTKYNIGECLLTDLKNKINTLVI